MRRGTALLAGLSGAFVAAATLIQMWIDWKQSYAEGLESYSASLKLAVVLAGVFSLAALLLGLLPLLTGERGREP